MKKFTLLVALTVCSFLYIQAQTLTLPYSQNFAALDSGSMENASSSGTALRAIPEGLDTVIRGYEAGGVLKIGTRNSLGSIQTLPIVSGAHTQIEISFKAIPWTGNTPWPAKVTVSYGDNRDTLDLPAAPHGWPLTIDEMIEYNVTFPTVSENTQVIIETINENGHDKRIFIDDLSIVGNAAETSVTDIKQSSIAIYPNPANNVAVIAFDGTNNAQVAIINLSGKTVANYNIEQGVKEMILDLKSLKAGSYLIRITTDKTVRTEHLIIQK